MEKQGIVPRLRFPEFEGEWDVSKLKDLTELITKGTTPSSFSNSGINFIKIESFDGNCIDINKCLFVSDKVHNGELGRSKLEEGDILFAIAGATIGKCNIVKEEMLPANTNQALAIVRLKEVNQRTFLYYVLTSKLMSKYIKDNIAVGAQPNLNLQQIGNFSFSLPTLPEQQKIASFFTAIDQRLTHLKRQKALLEQYKKGVMQKIFAQEIRFKIENKDGELVEPPNWERKRLKDVLFEHKTLNSGNRFTEVLSVAKQKGVINQIEHLGRSFAAKDISNYKVINPYDIVYTKSPTSDYPFGIIKQSQLDRSGVVSPLYGVFKPATPALGFMLHNYFLSWVNTYNYLKPLVEKGAKNTMNINNDTFLNGVKLNLPVSEKEQTKIANFLSAIDRKTEAVAEAIEATEKWKKGLMQQMFV